MTGAYVPPGESGDWPLDRPIPAGMKRFGGFIEPGQAVECVKCHGVFRREKTRESSRHCPSCLGWLPQDECSHHWEGDENGMVCGGCGTIREEWEDYSFD